MKSNVYEKFIGVNNERHMETQVKNVVDINYNVYNCLFPCHGCRNIYGCRQLYDMAGCKLSDCIFAILVWTKFGKTFHERKAIV